MLYEHFQGSFVRKSYFDKQLTTCLPTLLGEHLEIRIHCDVITRQLQVFQGTLEL